MKEKEKENENGNETVKKQEQERKRKPTRAIKLKGNTKKIKERTISGNQRQTRKGKGRK